MGRFGGAELGISVAVGKAYDLERLIEPVTARQVGAAISVGASAAMMAIEPRATPAALIDPGCAIYARKKERRSWVFTSPGNRGRGRRAAGLAKAGRAGPCTALTRVAPLSRSPPSPRKWGEGQPLTQ